MSKLLFLSHMFFLVIFVIEYGSNFAILLLEYNQITGI